MLTDKEKRFIINMLESDKQSQSMLRGFRKPNKEDKEIDNQYNKLIQKIESI